MARGTSSGKRPVAKLRVMAKLGENLYKTTKVFRMIEAQFVPKPKWNRFIIQNREQHSAWQEWWKSPQSLRWKNLQPKPPPRA